MALSRPKDLECLLQTKVIICSRPAIDTSLSLIIRKATPIPPISLGAGDSMHHVIWPAARMCDCSIPHNEYAKATVKP